MKTNEHIDGSIETLHKLINECKDNYPRHYNPCIDYVNRLKKYMRDEL